MLSKIKTLTSIHSDMSIKYMLFRSFFEIKKRTGIMKLMFPSKPKAASFISKAGWQKQDAQFFFASRDSLHFKKFKSESLKHEAEQILNGHFLYFNSTWFNLGKDYDWITNPENNYKYDIKKHWSEIPDFSEEQGDIKYVWEKSRFSFLYTIIRYDYHFEVDCSEFVFNEIIDWICKNPVNMGPNYRCSQEISLRILNWTFALNYYKHSKYLTEEIFNIILTSIYNQIIHVKDNINFSLIAVRNNHAITESLCLYLTGMLYPFFDISTQIKSMGKVLLEKEIDYQILPDGGYIQYSMNYHRVVLQLLTWALYLSRKNNEYFSNTFYIKIYSSLKFLFTCQDKLSGELPNYGANDGALFFKLSNQGFRNYSPQLNALYYYFFNKPLYNDIQIMEDVCWYNPDSTGNTYTSNDIKEFRTINAFNASGYYTIQETGSLTFIRCGSHKTRPSQADNLHMDIWYKGKNILRDGGSYKYNSNYIDTKFFFGTASHNTIMLGEYDQMLKGPRFIWFNWTEAIEAKLIEEEDRYVFEGTIKAFSYLDKNIKHRRRVTKYKNVPTWIIEDKIFNKPALVMKQIWNLTSDFDISFVCKDRSNNLLCPQRKDSWYSGKYGKKEPAQQIQFITENDYLKTEIRIIPG